LEKQKYLIYRERKKKRNVERKAKPAESKFELKKLAKAKRKFE